MATTSSTPFPLGVFVGNPNIDDSGAEATFDAANQAFDSVLGTKPAVMNSYIDFTQTPSEWASNNSWSAASAAASPSFKGEIPMIALPMGSTNVDAPSTQQILENYADGSYDSMLQNMVQAWKSEGFSTQYWRPGVEMNLVGSPGFVGSDTSLQALWITAFQHIYTALHAAAAADGVTMKVIWNPGLVNGTPAGNATEDMWPGKAYVDVVGGDIYGEVTPYSLYDWAANGEKYGGSIYDSTVAQFASNPINLEHYYSYPASDGGSSDGSGGVSLSLPQLVAFAEAQGLPIALPETGAGGSGAEVDAGLSDNAIFPEWEASVLKAATVPITVVSIWDADAGGNYEFSDGSKPNEAAAWAKYFGAQSTTTTTTTPITITPATETVATTDTASVTPFKGIVITDANSGQTETVIVTLSSAANGSLSDPNAATDGSTSATGVWSVSGSAAAVAADLDDLVFTPTANQVPAGVSVTTTLTLSLADTAGETTTATSTVTAKQAGVEHAPSPSGTRINGTDGTIYDTSGNAWTINSGQQIAENGTVVPSSAEVVTLFWTGAALDQLNTSGDWWTQPLDGSAGTELSAPPPGYDTRVTPITISPSDEAVATTGAAGVKPFKNVAIADANSGQTETATVSLSATANGTLSDPNAASDGSKIVSGVLTVSGSATAVATALDGLVFTPTKSQVAAGAAVTTTVTAAIKDTAGETASAASTITATQVITPAVDTLALHISEDAWAGNAEFTVSVDGKQVGGDYAASTLHSSGDAGTVLLTGDWGSGVNEVQVSFINDAYGGTSQTDRNLYVNSIAYNGVTYAGTTASLFGDGKDDAAFGGTTPTASAPADTLTLNLSEDAWDGNAQFVLYIDGKAVTTPQVVSALHDANATQSFSFTGNLGTGSHTIGVAYVNDSYGGKSTEDRNLYVDGVSINGSSVFSGTKEESGDGTSLFALTTAH